MADEQKPEVPFNPACNQSTGVTTFGRPHAAEVAASAQARYAVYRENQRKLEEATAKAEAERASEAEAKAAQTREATRLSFWDI